jgi:hypothetical protein
MLLTHDPRTEAEKLTAFKILKLARPDHLSDGKSIKKTINSHIYKFKPFL